MPSLFDRAGQRCEQNILRRWPAWRQAHLTGEDRPDFEAWKAANIAHLEALRARIVAGETPDIDRGWPDPAGWQAPSGAKTVPAEALGALETAKASVDRIAAGPVRASYSFNPSFLAAEKAENEDLKAADMRLLQEYEVLELRRPLGLTDAEDARRLELFRNFYDYRGG